MSYHYVEELSTTSLPLSQENIGKNHHGGANRILQIYGIN